MNLTIIGVFREGDKLILVDANNDQYEVTNKDELWTDLLAITNDANIPKAKMSAGQLSGDVDVIADTCDKLGDVVGERYGLLAGKGVAEVGRRTAPFLLRGLRHISKRKRFG